ncbi:MAG: epoxyqueuosine reductase QueH [Deltaproteobacteria bacterium]|uniref:Epoxyqueuosine reductase QueH n=1 Tax=Candidatus Acididesulfobacter diazotrophicus TaxID=2597226 RepID=A0A519BN66_9DELT|nr:epoxyqueuosine reductase QueH [Deltaproteobacteria bacterium]RZD18705.1 MAG: epoxyqueuosine reductase QueH [Candidatus Acididesulfobacter diazotrophicus]
MNGKLLLHICCAPCLMYPYKLVKEEFDIVIGYFYNPNIHPYTEYLKRQDTLKNFSDSSNLKVIYEKEYKIEEFFRNVVFREENRCYYCLSSRLEKTAAIAKSSKFDYFSTTLLYSKHQKHDFIKETGYNLEKKYGVKFYYADFREGYKEGVKLSYDYNLYRQNYCGCVYSEKERFYKSVK